MFPRTFSATTHLPQALQEEALLICGTVLKRHIIQNTTLPKTSPRGFQNGSGPFTTACRLSASQTVNPKSHKHKPLWCRAGYQLGSCFPGRKGPDTRLLTGGNYFVHYLEFPLLVNVGLLSVPLGVGSPFLCLHLTSA
ncbi:hypothetical protein CEXT_792391 [Caerostris extrusa]|uniref:Uncharacterized protein n=1 Tax=Caerostris extrusa TaxID=172846 RepID=A0AAV4TB44_CAEEX|nr:hypothetical protein CEXT_792391 [Caerostris extrusa]